MKIYNSYHSSRRKKSAPSLFSTRKFLLYGAGIFLIVFFLYLASKSFSPKNSEIISSRDILRAEEVLRSDPTNVKLCLKLGQAYFNLARNAISTQRANEYFDKTVEYLKRAQALDEEKMSQEAYYQLGKAYFEKSGHLSGAYYYQEAKEAFLNAERKGFSNKESHTYLGHIYLKDKLYDEAIKEYKEALSFGQEDPAIYFNLGWTYKDSKKYKEAIPAFKKVLSFEGVDREQFINSHLALGWLYYQENLIKESIGSYKNAIELVPDSVQAHYWLGKAYKKEGKLKEAKEEWEKCLKLDPGNKDVLKQLKNL
ncbi:tetratricopeptide repeat protein [bacterium]|nr:tetratricopeptide repeat protein [bacterium]MBU1614360.1 tetratricopeptide repeat protein [bacterium]